MPARRSRASSRAWSQTALWKALEKRASARGNLDASEFLPTLTAWMRHLEEILRHGGTSPLDFTLHDADHSFRVAERIHQLLTRTTRGNLSDYELALLLLASYGHDIGMTPQRDKVLAHHRHLFGHADALTAEETKAYQEFLDEYPAAQPIRLPLTTSPEDLNLADELTTFYVRERHNDWSAEWLRENLKGGSFGQLPGIVDHLVRLCSSHHWPFSRLKRDDFNPFTVGHGNTASIVHPRFLACLLRLADILENDPERTPEILFRHRSIQDRYKSLIHWQKDHALTITPVGEDRLRFLARPRSARVHKALLDLADAIDHELHGIASIGELMPAEYRIGKNTIRRQWHLAPALVRDIHPADDDSYEYIDGAFRPDTARLLQLLSGEQLYGNPLVAVRELLQNAFDAVREKIARLRLGSHLENPVDRTHEETLGNHEKVTLTLRPGDHGGWLLICEDSGVGLNRSLINKHLLVSGNNRRHDLLDLERRCQAAGFRLARTGQFGIGVLSYFMLADEVEITTTRSQLCGDHDAPGWTFSTRGVGSFGELRKLPQAPFPSAGTRLTWKLGKTHTQDPAKFANDLLAYLKQTLIRIPCRLEFKTEGLPGDPITWKRSTGWVKTEEEWLADFRNQIQEKTRTRLQSHGVTLPYQSDERLQKEAEADSQFEAAKQHALSTLRCSFFDVELPDGNGLARYILAYHELEKGRCVTPKPDAFDDDEIGTKLPKQSVKHVTTSSWMGMRCDLNHRFLVNTHEFHLKIASVEVDVACLNSSPIWVNRLGMNISADKVAAWEKHLKFAAEAWSDQVLSGGASDCFREVNLSLQERTLELSEGRMWFHSDEPPMFRPIQRPMALPINFFGRDLRSRRGYATRLTNSSRQMVSIIEGGGERSKINTNCELRFIEDDRSRRQPPCLYWPSEPNPDGSIFKRFPSEWRDVGIVRVSDRNATLLSGDNSLLFLNQDNPITALLGSEPWCVFKLLKVFSVSVWQELDEADSAELAAIAFCKLVQRSFFIIPEEWSTYSQQRSDHLSLLWELIAKKTKLQLNDLRLIATDGSSVAEITPSGLRSERDYDTVIVPQVTDPAFLLHETML